MCEILAPVGSMENLIVAVNSGADAVYLGLKDFSARKTAGNFTFEELDYAVSYAKLFGVKVYVTVNTLIKNTELNDFLSAVSKAYSLGVDAFILQDVFLGKYIKSLCKDICLHLSTQAGVCNVYGAIQAKNFGFSRVILARETSFEDIKAISNVIETEVFIHGALCTSFSGHCYFSSFIGGNSGNRGYCKQPCRKKYRYECDGKTVKSGYVLSLADLSSQNDLSKYVDAGVSSFKIEGRLRSAEYLASTVAFYKKLLKTGEKDENLYRSMLTAFNRGDYTNSLAFGQEKSFISNDIQGHKGLKVGKIAQILPKNTAKVSFDSAIYSISCGDAFKIIRNCKEVGNGTIMNINGKPAFNYKGDVLLGDYLYLTKKEGLFTSLPIENRKKPIVVDVYAVEGECLTLSCQGVTVTSNDVLPLSKSAPANKEDVIKSLNKTDVYPFLVNVNFVKFSQNVFILKSLLNGLRAELYNKIFYGKNHKNAFNIAKYEYLSNVNISMKTPAIIVDDLSKLSNIYENIYAPYNYNQIDETFNYSNVWLYLPPYLTTSETNAILKIANKFKGIYGNGYWALEFAKMNGLKLFAGVGFNVFNLIDVISLRDNGVENITLSKELSAKEIDEFNDSSLYVLTGAVEIMDLIYCPFSKNCKNCEISNNFTLIDEENRVFPVKRYKSSACRFKVYNNAELNYRLNNSKLVDKTVVIYDKTRGNYAKGVK